MEYDSPYTDGGGGTTGIGILKRPIFVDIKSANERINISACGNTFTDDWKADIYYVGAQPPLDSNSYTGTYAAYPPASGTLISTGLTNANGTIGTNANNVNCDNNSQLTSGTMTYPVSVLASSGPGVYEIRLQNLTQNINAAAPLTLFRQFDISVTNPTTPTVKIPAAPNPQLAQGRVWSYVWAFNAGGFGVANSTNQNYYVVVPGGVPGTNFVWQLDLNQFAGYVYELVANNRGVDSPNATAQNVRGLSVPISGNSVSPQYRMYLTYPDQTFTRPTVGPSISNLRFEDSAGQDNTFTPGGTAGIQDTGFFRFTSSLPGTYEVIIDINKDGVFGDASGLDVQLRGDTDALGNVSALWNGRNNAGAVLPVGSYNAQIEAITGEYHFIAGDVETSGPVSGLTINEATSPSTTATTPVYWDDKTILGGTGTTTLPNGTVGGRHTWGTTSLGGGQGSNGNSWGDLRYLDTFVYGSFSVANIPAIIADVDNNDWGDAPDTYGTNKTNSSGEGIGASQLLSATIKLGTASTDEDPQPFTSGVTVADGQPSAGANGDDTNGTDDEDGVTSFPNLAVGDSTYTVSVNLLNNSGANAYLGGWIDFNRNGRFEVGEGVVQTIAASAASQNINVTWSGLSGLVAGDTFARFRINNDPLTTSDFIGGKRNGEVEDYPLTITGAGTTYDYGDAPDIAVGNAAGNYNTTSGKNGAGHIISANLKLGANAPDADSGSLQNVNADADDITGIDDEDGVSLPNTLNTASTTYTATVTVTNTVGTPATLVGWIDFNKNGLFEVGEARTITVADNTTNGTVNLTWSGLSGLQSGITYARFRISNGTLTTSTPTGIIGRGEVEDYLITINPIDFGDAPDSGAGVGIGNYETLNASGGASHTIISTLKIGTNTTDSDNGLAQNANADFDDITGTDDEDGVIFNTPLTTSSTTYSTTVNVTNITGSATTLVAWVDFNKDGLFAASEGQIASVPNNASSQNIILNWSGITPPALGVTYARFRLSDSALTTSTPNGAVGNGEVEDYRIAITVPTDYGDAPDGSAGTGVGNYRTLSSDGGASHTIISSLKLGANAPDSDDGLAQNVNADFDDITGVDDEDGVIFPATLATSSTAYSATVNVTNTTGSATTLVGWIDFDKNGVFAVGEAQTQSIPNNTIAQNITLNWSGISGLTPGNTYARFRISNGALTTSTPDGAVGNGEVEDYLIVISNTDYGDAPDTGAGTGVGNYQTTSVDGGASHTILATLKLGTNAPDADSGTLQNATADADDITGIDDEDGIATFPALATSSTTYSVTVNVLNNTGTARPLVGWVDFNKDGVFAPSEGVLQSVPTNAASQNIPLNWTGLSGLTAGTTYGRFRISDGALTTSTPNGAVGNGEVEDYQITITFISSVPKLNLVKRITAINNTPITGFVDDGIPNNEDNDAKWPGFNSANNSNTYTIGVINTTASPRDKVEYTIYFLNTGSGGASNVQICDALSQYLTYVPNSYDANSANSDGGGTTNLGIALNFGGSNFYMTGIGTDAPDRGEFVAPNVVSGCQVNSSGSLIPLPNPNGTVKVGLTRSSPSSPTSIPAGGYGYIRFWTTVN